MNELFGIEDIFDITLPTKEVSLASRLGEIRQQVNVAIYASNFIPVFCKVTATGNRRLAIATFGKDILLSVAIKKLILPDYELAVIEDLIAMVKDTRFTESKYLTGDWHSKFANIVCLGSRFEMMGEDGNLVSQHIFFDNPIEKLTIGLVPQEVIITPSVGLLLVKK